MKKRWSALFSAASMGVDPIRPMTPYETIDIINAVNEPEKAVGGQEKKDEPPQAF